MGGVVDGIGDLDLLTMSLEWVSGFVVTKADDR